MTEGAGTALRGIIHSAAPPAHTTPAANHAATGTFTMTRLDTIDFATGQAFGDGTFEGQLNLNN